MWYSSGLIVIIMGIVTTAFQLTCVTNFLNEEDQHGTTVYLGKDGDRMNVMEALIISNVSWTVIDRFNKIDDKQIDLPANYLIISGDDDSEELIHEAIHSFSTDVNNWNPSARMVVVLPSSDTYNFASRVITYLWNHMVYDTVIIFMSEVDVEQIYSASPFDKGNSCGMRAKTLRNYTCGYRTNGGPLWHHPDVYPNCPLRVSRRQTPPFSFNLSKTHFVRTFNTGEWQGSDVQFIRLLRERKKLKVLWSERSSPESGTKSQDVHHYYKNLTRYGIDLAIGGGVMLSEYVTKAAYLRQHDQHRLIYYVADADEMRGWPILHTMFSISTWIVLGLAIFLAGLVYSLMMNETPNLTRTKFLTIFSILVSQTMVHPKRWSPRLFLCTLLLPFYHISSLHMTAIQSFMLHPPLNKPIITEDDLIAHDFTVFVSDVNIFFTKDKRSGVRFVVSNDSLETRLMNMEKYRNFSVLARSLEANFLINIYQLKIHQLDEGITAQPICMAMSKGNMYFDLIDNMVQQALQVGLFAKWMGDLSLFRRRNSGVITAGRAALDMGDMECAFLLLIVGYTAAASAFCSEHLFHRWQKRITIKRPPKTISRRRRVVGTNFNNHVVERQHN